MAILTGYRSSAANGARNGKTDVQSESPEAEEQAWLPRQDADGWGAGGAESAPAPRPAASDRDRRLEVNWEVAGLSAARGTGESQRWPRARRLTRSRDIRALLKRGKRSRTAHLDVFDSSAPVAHPRAGLVVPRHKHAVVERNRLKRRLREILRQQVLPRLDEAGLAVDVLVRARREAYDATFATLERELIDWTERRCSRESSSA